MLEIVDLDATAQAVYEAVVTGQSTAAELAAASGASGAHLQEILERLQGLGLVAVVPGIEPAYVAAPPDTALEAVLLEKEKQLKRARLFAQRLTEAHRRSTAAGDPVRLVEVVAGREAVVRRFQQVQRACRRELRIIDKPPYALAGPEENVGFERELLERGVRWRAIYDPAGLDDGHDLTGDVQVSVALGEEARVLAGPAPTKLVLADDRVGMIPLQIAPSGIDSIVVVYPSALLEALAALFEQLWERALPLPLPGRVTAGRSPREPTEAELQLLSLLTAGLPDDRIAGHLGVSPRTLQRRIRALLDRLGARTRFQAGIRATLIGWVDGEK
ncbi:transcriptional regulator [Actinorhabdospora filicis]|uniref:Transcriptional regulator n=1 Tax=Actinorhabdospora filicis TaxID=1785913 RepID=A0A9W6STA0_9ACTN|nr:LuxR family transcriptional regulator [Actinorhabdospora filicis]GLZ81942.1 transcriptional regulator [Actinorhabdospora filicis]